MSAIASASAPPDAITAAHYSDPPPANVALNKLPIDECRGEWAMWGVIATELMLFVCMFGSYFYLGTNQDRWAVDVPPRHKNPFFRLAILLASRFVLERGKVLV
jgi:heme/copper-type cytochrome/quinol oxidase subunit 3